MLLSRPYHAGIVTCAAPNANLVHNQTILRNTMRERIERILCAFQLNGDENLVLGAFGCGVFKNNPVEVANTFKDLLSNKFQYSFKRILFAITNPQMFQIFEQIFDGNYIDQIDEQRPLNTNQIQYQHRTTNQRKKYHNNFNQDRLRKYQNDE